ncbi:hypothetical protein GOV13_02165 [Candidatus Pacearchaeota archaeon]|nr:hypothetical protein [Candidatus Pacearchaeota archaeon]
MSFEACEQLFAGNATALMDCPFAQAFAGGAAAGLVALGVAAISLIILAFYIYHAIAWMTIARKLKYKNAWFAWIPFLATAMRLQLGGFHWAWTFLWLIPIVGWIALFILMIISTWKIFAKRKYPGWFSLSQIIPKLGGILYLVIIGFVAWEDRKKMLFK